MKETEILDFIRNSQAENGEFQSFCCLPKAENPTWYYSGDSPFVTGNVLFALRNIKDAIVVEIIEKGIEYLKSLQEKNGLWRYWKHNNGIMEYNVPCDVDDTALVYFLMRPDDRNNSKHIRELLIRNQSTSGNFNTWFIPTLNHLKNLKDFRFLVFDLVKSRGIFLPNKKIPNKEAISSLFDSEPAVNAHVIMALGENKNTQKAIQNLMNQVKDNHFVLQYYDHPCFVYHHISRAYNEGVKSLEPVCDQIINALLECSIFKKEDEFFILNVLNLISLHNLGFTDFERVKEKIDFVHKHFNSIEKFVPYKYWTSKQRSWWAGSPSLTAALFLEFISLFPQD